MLRTVWCDHAGQVTPMPGSDDGGTVTIPAVEPYPRSKVVLGDVTLLLSLALCVSCTDLATGGAAVIVGPRDGDPTTPRMAVHAASLREIKRRQAGRRPTTAKVDPPIPQNVRTTRKVAGHAVTLFADPRLAEREIVAWSRRYAASEITAAVYRRILAAITAGPEPAPGKRPNLAAADVPPREPLPAGGKTDTSPMKRETKVRLLWSPRLGYYDGNQPPVSKRQKKLLKGK